MNGCHQVRQLCTEPVHQNLMGLNLWEQCALQTHNDVWLLVKILEVCIANTFRLPNMYLSYKLVQSFK